MTSPRKLDAFDWSATLHDDGRLRVAVSKFSRTLSCLLLCASRKDGTHRRIPGTELWKLHSKQLVRWTRKRGHRRRRRKRSHSKFAGRHCRRQGQQRGIYLQLEVGNPNSPLFIRLTRSLESSLSLREPVAATSRRHRSREIQPYEFVGDAEFHVAGAVPKSLPVLIETQRILLGIPSFNSTGRCKHRPRWMPTRGADGAPLIAASQSVE